MNIFEGTAVIGVSLNNHGIGYVGHTLHQEITNEQDRDSGVVLNTFEVQVFFEGIQSRLG